MKKLIFLLALTLALAFTATAQRTISDSINGNETVNFTAMVNASEVQITLTNIGGTTDGTMTLQGSTDGVTFTNIQPTAGLLYYFPSDTANLTGYTWTMVTANTLQIVIDEGNHPLTKYLRIQGVGTASDSTLVVIKWSK